MLVRRLLARALLAVVGQTAIATASFNIIGLEERDLCPAGSHITQVFVSNVVIEFPVYINTFISQNTIININNINIAINNAPTQFVTTFIGTSTVVSTSTMYVLDYQCAN
jgi:hypothetical protein